MLQNEYSKHSHIQVYLLISVIYCLHCSIEVLQNASLSSLRNGIDCSLSPVLFTIHPHNQFTPFFLLVTFAHHCFHFRLAYSSTLLARQNIVSNRSLIHPYYILYLTRLWFFIILDWILFHLLSSFTLKRVASVPIPYIHTHARLQ